MIRASTRIPHRENSFYLEKMRERIKGQSLKNLSTIFSRGSRTFCDSSSERPSRSDRAFDVNSPRKISARDCGWHVEMRAFVPQSWRSRSGNPVLRDWGTAEVSRSPRWRVNESKDFANESGGWIVPSTRLTRWCSGHRWPASYDCMVIGNSLEIHFFRSTYTRATKYYQLSYRLFITAAHD